MRYSFVIIAYNEEGTILSTIDSILALDQLKDSYEILVIDDGSTDKTNELVNSYSINNTKIRLVGDGGNHGRGFCRFTGVDAAKGNMIAMVDADIILPKNWLAVCLGYITKYNAVGGTAVPDGDVSYVHRRFSLIPKTVIGSTVVAGSNGLYKKQIFNAINFNRLLKEGEDVDFNHRLKAAGFTAYRIGKLTVSHQEHKSLLNSMAWLFQSGIGATRQLIIFREIRLPDIAFFVSLGSLVIAVIATSVLDNLLPMVLPGLVLVVASFAYLRSRFYLTARSFVHAFAAIITNALLIACYYAGRVVGLAKYILNDKARSS